MSQMTFSDYEYSLRKRKTKREEFLDIMNEIIPWEEWVEFVRPYYPNGKRGRPTKGIEKMLRMYLLQIWFNLSDEGVEDAIYDSYAFLCIPEIHEYRLYGGTGSRCNNASEIPSFAGRKPSGGSVFQGDQSCDGSYWAYHARRYDRRCNHYFCTEFDQKCREETGSGNVSDQKGKCMEIRDEMPHWGGFRKWFGAYNHSHSSQCTRYNRSAQITAGGRSCCIWRQRIYWN